MKKGILHHFSSSSYLLVALLLLSLMVRLYRISNPVADWHAFRQADTASVTREYVKHGVHLLLPKYHDLSNIQSGYDNKDGLRMVEFPFINAAIASLVRAMPTLPFVLTSRLVAVFASVATTYFLYSFIKNMTENTTLSLLSGFFFAALPFSVYYSRVILPEPFILFFSVGSLALLTHALSKKRSFITPTLWASAIFLALAALLKPFVVFLAPAYLAVIVHKKGFRGLLAWQWLVYALIVAAPLWWWRTWILQFPAGIPASDWLLNGNGIRFRPAWFRWIFYERFTKLILGYAGVLIVTAGIFLSSRLRAVVWAWWAGLITYTAVIATGNVQHDYYQVLFLPLIAITLALGVYGVWQKTAEYFFLHPFWVKIMRGTIIIAIFTMLWLSWKQVAGYFNVNHWEYIRAGEAVDTLVPTDAKVIAPAFGDTHFLFQTNRTGWPIGFDIQDKINLGATHYVTTSYDDEARELEQHYSVITKNNEFMIVDLMKPTL